MSAYNAGPFLMESVDSILGQTFEDFEFVIINDGSTDQTAEILESLTDPRVRVIHQKNKGLGRPQNDTIRECRGKYVMRMDADDRCHSDRIAKQVAILEGDPKTVMVGTFFKFFGSGEQTSSISKLPTTHDEILGGMLKGWHTMAHATIMFRRSLFDKIEGYLISGAGEDWALLLDASRFGNYAMIAEPLYEVRVHSASNAWRGAMDVAVGFQFARARHKHYLKTKSDLTLQTFMATWDKAGFFTKAKTRFAAISSVLHRKAILERLRNQRIVPFFRMVAAAMLDPTKTMGAIRKRLKT